MRRSERVEELERSKELSVSIRLHAVVLSGAGVDADAAASSVVVQFDETQLYKQVDGRVDVRRAQPVLAQQLRWHEALHDVMAAAVEPARTTLWCRQ